MSIPKHRFPRRSVTDYDRVRPRIESGDLLLCSGTGTFSRMIKAATESVWSHVGFVIRLDVFDRIMVLESVEPLGVRTVPLRKYLVDYDNRGNPYPGRMVVARHRRLSGVMTSAAMRMFGKFAVDLFGYPYDKDEILRIAGRIMVSHLPFSGSDRKALRRDREYICSEYVWECYRKLGITIEHDRKGFISPADFAKAREVELVAVLKGS